MLSLLCHVVNLLRFCAFCSNSHITGYIFMIWCWFVFGSQYHLCAINLCQMTLNIFSTYVQTIAIRSHDYQNTCGTCVCFVWWQILSLWRTGIWHPRFTTTLSCPTVVSWNVHGQCLHAWTWGLVLEIFQLLLNSKQWFFALLVNNYVLKMLCLYLDTLIIGHILCSMFCILNENALKYSMTNKVLDHKKKMQPQQKRQT